jgi:uncharacterized membrane protein (DUF485 family)
MLGFVKWLLKMFVVVFVAMTLFAFYVYISIKLLKTFNVQDYLSQDNLVIAAITPAVILSFGTINFCKSFFKKLQEQK